MANLQIKGIDDQLYARIKELAAAENRSVSQQILFLAKRYMAQKRQESLGKTAAQTLIDLAGSLDDERSAEVIISELKAARKKRQRRAEGML